MFLTFNRKTFDSNAAEIKALLSAAIAKNPCVALLGQYDSSYFKRPHWLTHVAYVEHIMKQATLALANNSRVFLHASEVSESRANGTFRYIVDAPRHEHIDVIALHAMALREKTRLAALLPPFCVVVVISDAEWYIHSTTPLLTANKAASIFSTELCAPLGCVFGISHTTTPTVTTREWRHK